MMEKANTARWQRPLKNLRVRGGLTEKAHNTIKSAGRQRAGTIERTGPHEQHRGGRGLEGVFVTRLQKVAEDFPVSVGLVCRRCKKLCRCIVSRRFFVQQLPDERVRVARGRYGRASQESPRSECWSGGLTIGKRIVEQHTSRDVGLAIEPALLVR